MKPNVLPIERAFELAKSGRFVSVADVKKNLHADGYSTGQITGRLLSKQLMTFIRAARRA